MNNDERKTREKPGLGRLYFGIMLVGFGALLLLDALDIVHFNFSILLALAIPLVIIGVGLSLLKVQTKIIGIVLITLAVAGMVLAALFYNVDGTETNNFSVEREADEATLQLQLGASDINVNSADLDSIVVRGELESTYLDLNTDSSVSEDVQDVNIRTEGSSKNFWNFFEAGASNLDLEVTRAIPLTFNVDAGAVDLSMDLREIQLNSLQLQTGASNMNIRLGEPTEEVPVNIDSGISSIKLTVPEGTALRVQSEGALNNIDISDVISRGDNVYETENFADAESYYNISLEAGLSNVEIEWE